MKIKPLGDRVLAQPIEVKNKTASGIIIPDEAKEKSNKAKVIVVSQELKDSEKNQIKEGDTILYKDFSGDKTELDGEKYILLQTEDIMAIM